MLVEKCEIFFPNYWIINFEIMFIVLEGFSE